VPFEKKQDIYGFLVKNLDLYSKFYYLKKFIKKVSKIFKLTRKTLLLNPERKKK
jgi:hypothetical protein